MPLRKSSKLTVLGNAIHNLIKLIAFLICFTGFVYQAWKFSKFFLKYPTVMDIKIERDREFFLPAYTFCTEHPVPKDKYCADKSRRCSMENNDEERCDAILTACADNKTKAYTENEIKAWKRLKFELHDVYWRDLQKIYLPSSDLHVDYLLQHYSNNFREVEGPFFQADTQINNLLCYTKGAAIANDQYLQQMDFRDTKFFPYIQEFEFTVYPNERFHQWRKAGVYFHIHSPWEATKPSESGVFLEPGRSYSFHIQMEEEQLLPHPYDTDCLDYTLLWENNNRTGPRSSMMCRHYCRMIRDLYCQGCVQAWSTYPVNVSDMCSNFGFARLYDDCTVAEYWGLLKECSDYCKEECLRLKYTYTHMSSPIIDEDPSNEEKGRKLIEVRIFVNVPEVRVLRHNPKYEDVELFSYIGGFLGIWLGVSLFSLLKTFKNTFIYCKSGVKDIRIVKKIAKLDEKRETIQKSSPHDLSFIV